jgi:succinoglycan biosynthesis transport protein ExoP
VSRNFELLDQAGRLQQMLEPAVDAPAPQTKHAADEAPSTPAVEVAAAVRDEVAKLVFNLFLLPGAESPRQVVFAGTEKGTGCSWMCARVGEVLASQTSGSVCVVDCNLRSPSLHQQFAISNHFGLSDALVQSNPVHQYVRQLSRRNLWLLSCGSSTDNWQENVTSENLKRRLTELRCQFDYVLIDAAPMNTCKDCIVLGKSSDGVVLVLKANSSNRKAARKALQELQAARTTVLGAVLNQRTFPIPDSIYRRL